MKRLFLYFFPALFLLFDSSFRTAEKASPLKIVIIRHGEKPDKGDNLSCAGLNRSLQLPAVLYSKIGMPSYIFAPSINLGKSTGAARMYQTIVPFAVKYNLKINTKYDVGNTKDLAKDVLERSGTVLIVWEHKEAAKLAKHLGVDDPNLKWDDTDFDSMWVITVANGKATLARDKENLHPATACP